MTGELSALIRPELAALEPYAAGGPNSPARPLANDPGQPGPMRIKLDANELPHSLPRAIADDLARYLSVVDLNRYPDSDCGELREVVAAEAGVAPSQILFGNGSDELIALLCTTFARARPGAARAAVLYPVPTFSMFRIAALASGLDAVPVPLGPEFSFPRTEIERALEERRPNLAFFARPNNPTGGLWPSEAIADMARSHPDKIFVSDEAYVDFAGDSMIAMTSSLPNLVVLRTLSKIGLAALRVGFLHAQPEILGVLEKVRPPYNIGALNQCAALFVLRNHRGLIRERCAEVVRERERVAAALRANGAIHVYDSQANLLLFRVPDPPAVWSGLSARGVLVRKFADATGDLAGCLRVTIGTPSENDEFHAALAEAV